MITASLHNINTNPLYCNLSFDDNTVLVLRGSSAYEKDERLTPGHRLIKNYLHPGEQKKLFSLKSHKRKHEFLMGRVLLKRLILKMIKERCIKTKMKCSQILVENIIDGPQKGMPELKSENGTLPPWSISVSHKEDVALAGVTDRGKIGVDAEDMLSRTQLENPVLVDPDDQEFLRQRKFFTDIGPCHRATLLWCAKEAIGKLFGLGFHYGMKSFQLHDFHLHNGSPHCFITVPREFNREERKVRLFYGFLKQRCYVIAHSAPM